MCRMLRPPFREENEAILNKMFKNCDGYFYFLMLFIFVWLGVFLFCIVYVVYF